MTSTYDAYRMITANLQRSMRSSSAQPSVVRKAAYFNGKAATVMSIRDVVTGPRRFADALEAGALRDLAAARGFITRALKGAIDSASSFTKKPGDQRYPDVFKVETAQLARRYSTETSRRSIDKQALLLAPNLAVTHFKYRTNLRNALVRFAGRWRAAKSPQRGSNSLLTVDTSQVMMSPELALSIQGFRTR